MSSEASSQLSNVSNLTCGTPPLNNPLFRPLVSPVMGVEPKLVPVNQSEVKYKFQNSDATESVCEVIDSDEEELMNFPLLSALLSYINSAVSITLTEEKYI